MTGGFSALAFGQTRDDHAVPWSVALTQLWPQTVLGLATIFGLCVPIVLAAAIYLALLWPVVRLISRLERRMAA